jgi:UDP-N-acetylglucosamine--N-acetylmuramyl-(pentapeptide) pyrophosphoryl-undecaprenol N-acetylglucosamine transferase
MKIVFTGGSTGGHFYPLIAVAEAINDITIERHILQPQLFYIAPTPFDEEALFANNIQYIKSPAGKMRRYRSVLNFTDGFKTIGGIFFSLMRLFRIYPDVVFSKGGFASVPTVIAAHILRIPIVIHESDAKPGRANLLAAKYAYRIGVAFDSATQYFPEKTRSKIARTGIPIRKIIAQPPAAEDIAAVQLLHLDTTVPTILVIGGSLGSKRINETLLGALPDILSFANVSHQTGKDNYTETVAEAGVIIDKSPNKSRYHAFPYLTATALRGAANASKLIVSRAGATSIAEISLWNRPAILIPIPESVSHDQRTNAYSYAHTGAAVVLEEANMTPHVLASEIRRISTDPQLSQTMAARGAAFGSRDAARIIADELIAIGLSHTS